MGLFTTPQERSIYDRIDRINDELSTVYGDFWECFLAQLADDPRINEYKNLVEQLKTA